MGIAMLYLLETCLLLPMIYANLSDDAILIAEVARAAPERSGFQKQKGWGCRI
jgi:hypothetical protein